jgi:uncharacterized protein YjiS (DUF1127 family)
MVQAVRLVAHWRERALQRQQLGRLSDWQLQDIGIDRHAAQAEASKMFWRD